MALNLSSLFYSTASSVVVNSLNVVASSVYFNDDEEQKLWNEIVEKDILNTAKMVENYITEIKFNENVVENGIQTIKELISQMYSLCKQISSDISYIKTKRAYNNNIWLFQKVRKFNIKSTMKSIIQNNSILEKKLELLKSLISFSQMMNVSNYK